MIFHIINTTKYPFTSPILANDARIVHTLMPIPVLFARKAALFGFRTTIMPTRPMLSVSVEMFPKVTASPKTSLRRAPRVSATPEPVTVENTILREVGLVEGGDGGRRDFDVREGCG